MRVARSNTRRHAPGLRNGSRPSMTSISASAANRISPKGVPGYFFAAEGSAAPAPRMDLKNSLFASSTMTSDLLRKLAR